MSLDVKVTNRNNTIRFKDRYGGFEYKLEPGETITMPAEAAEHIFGYGLEPKERFKKLMRMGLGNHPSGQKIFDNVVIRPVGHNVEPTGKERDVA